MIGFFGVPIATGFVIGVIIVSFTGGLALIARFLHAILRGEVEHK